MRLALLHLLCFVLVCLPWTVERGRATMQTVIARGRKLLLHSPYVLPTNATEIERLDAQHYLELSVFGANVLAPVKRPRTIVDLGCGTGLWCREVARQFPKATVLGIDYNLERVKVTGAKLPPRDRPKNVTWREVDALEPLPLCDNSVDYVHIRFAATWIPRTKWLPVLEDVLRILKPGGCLELMEGCMPESESEAYQALGRTMIRLLISRGLSDLLPQHLTDLLHYGGFVDIGERQEVVGARTEEQLFLFETTRQGFAAISPLLARTLKPVDYATYQRNLAEVERTRPHVTRRDCAAWGRKPVNL
jgi:SAM-dependent methyltransferase